MKTASLAPLMLLLLTTSVIAQVKTETSDPPDISVLEKSWSKKTRYREWNQNPRADKRPPNEDLMREARDGRSVSGNLKDSPTGVRTANETAPIGPRYTTYVYKIKAKNNGLKTIKGLYWEYRFLYPDTQRVLGTHRMVSFKNLSPGKTGVFKAEMEEPPVAFISDAHFDKEFQLKFTEQLIILRVDYTDGSVWRRP
jgi:hypothetical protein